MHHSQSLRRKQTAHLVLGCSEAGRKIDARAAEETEEQTRGRRCVTLQLRRVLRTVGLRLRRWQVGHNCHMQRPRVCFDALKMLSAKDQRAVVGWQRDGHGIIIPQQMQPRRRRAVCNNDDDGWKRDR
jgi:hypothetical protein